MHVSKGNTHQKEGVLRPIRQSLEIIWIGCNSLARIKQCLWVCSSGSCLEDRQFAEMWFYQVCNAQEKAEESNGLYKLLR